MSAAAERLLTVRPEPAQIEDGIPIGHLSVTLGYTEAEAAARVIGADMLTYLLFSGELVDAAEASRIGLVHRVVEPEEPTAHTARLVERMCGRPLGPGDTEQLTRFAVEAYGGPDLCEGVAAFIEGRDPRFARAAEEEHGRA